MEVKNKMKKILIVILGILLLFVNLGSIKGNSMLQGKASMLQGKVVTDKNEYAPNETVKFLYVITNPTASAVTLTFNTTQIYNFVIMKDNKIIFNWGINMMFAQVITKFTIPANGSKAFSILWDMIDLKGNKVQEGTYTVKFYLVNNNGAEAQTTFTIGKSSESNAVFPDVTDYYISKYLKVLVDKGIVKGYPDHTFGATRNLTRAEATVLILRSLNIEPQNFKISSFEDVPVSHWAHNYIEEGVKRNIIKGVGNNLFAPSKNITRGEFVTILIRALSLTNENAVSIFVDVPYNYFGYREIATAFNLNIVQGSVENNNLKFYPNDPIKRVDAVLMLARAMDVKQ